MACEPQPRRRAYRPRRPLRHCSCDSLKGWHEHRGNYGSQSAVPAPLLAKCCTTQAQPITTRVRKISADREEIVNKKGQVNSLVHQFFLFICVFHCNSNPRAWIKRFVQKKKNMTFLCLILKNDRNTSGYWKWLAIINIDYRDRLFSNIALAYHIGLVSWFKWKTDWPTASPLSLHRHTSVGEEQQRLGFGAVPPNDSHAPTRWPQQHFFWTGEHTVENDGLWNVQ